MARIVHPSPIPVARGPLWNGAVPMQKQIGPFANGILTGKHSAAPPYANFGPQGHRRYGLKLKPDKLPTPTPPPSAVNPWNLDDYVKQGRTSFGTPMAAPPAKLWATPFVLQDADMVGQVFIDPSMVRVTVDKGEVTASDPATTERTEFDTLLNGPIPLVGSKPVLGMSFDFYIPTNQPVPAVSSSVVLQQFKVTSSDAFQVLHHQSGVLRLRRATFGTNQMLAANVMRGRWHHVDVDGKWSKVTDGYFIAKVDGVEIYNATGIATVLAAAADNEKVYLKFGCYRAAADTDPARGLYECFFKNIVIRTAATFRAEVEQALQDARQSIEAQDRAAAIALCERVMVLVDGDAIPNKLREVTAHLVQGPTHDLAALDDLEEALAMLP